ncbi:uncharacterized protein LOC126474131 [Schistocerca serialis cubense]|uniref:uncharacterized protein LOC126474131 n=1 Tax=Schistocerca serialis cubense TaxID=2023355 RepID=UPI00214E50CC|nr:uncharacterized protein LOC126474131 [Schistocerca serialis cubense]
MSSSCRLCVNHLDEFCYICGEYVLQKNRKNITPFVKEAYLAYFGIKLGDQDKAWAPHKVCKCCVECLRQWTKRKRKSLNFGVPMVWREQKDHTDDCYFCIVNVKGFNRFKKRKWEYPDLESARRPVVHSNDVPVPAFTTLPTLTSSDDDVHDEECTSSGSEYEGRETQPQQFDQKELSDLIRELNLSKQASELLASRLKEKNCLHPSVKITAYWTREENLLPYFNQEEVIVYCSNIPGLLLELGLPEYRPEDWRLFIDSSTRSLKCVLLHNGNRYASIPIAHSTKLCEAYANIKMVLQKIQCMQHHWLICVDLKMVNFLLGQQSGYTKHPCFICMWDSRAKHEHWKQKTWPPREHMAVGEANIINEPLVSRDKIVLPPLHIKLGLMKQFTKALDRNGNCFTYICNTFPGLSCEKLKAGIFDGPQIRRLINDTNFTSVMTVTEASALEQFCRCCKMFFGQS